MHGVDTQSEFPAVRLPHLHVEGARKLDEAIGKVKQLFTGNGYLLVKLSGGNIDSAQPLLPIKSE